MLIISVFKFYPVGQGLFYSGQINKLKGFCRAKSYDPHFNFVFDIGSSSKDIDDLIKNYVNSLNKDIDYVFISHFDKDHFIGLGKLIREMKIKKMKIKNLVIPFDSMFKNLYVNFFNNSGVVINVIVQNEDDENMQSIQRYLSSNLGIKTWKFSLKLIKGRIKDSKIEYIKQKLFNFRLMKVLSEPCAINSIDYSEKEIDYIKSIYKSSLNQNQINYSSINLLHGRIIKDNNNKEYIENGTLLTGDSNWKSINNQRIFKKWLDKNLKSIDDISYLQVPHHGSYKNWDYNTTLLKPSSPIDNAIFSFGLCNNYGHPGPNVSQYFNKDSKKVQNVTEKTSYSYYRNI